MKFKKSMPVVMTIAGSDSGGGAGIQADLKTFYALGVFGTSAITCLTAQNPRTITAVHAAGAGMVAAQIDAVCDYFPVAAIKTGMLFNEEIILAVAAALRRRRFRHVVIDPVCRSTSGHDLLQKKALRALCEKLLPLATVITPNAPEAELILSRRILTPDDQRAAAEELGRRFGTACVVKGGHLKGRRAVDVLFHSGRLHEFRLERLGPKLHGTGCVFSAALAARLALGHELPRAVGLAKQYVFRLIQACNDGV